MFEIEKKYLLNHLPNLSKLQGEEIEQIYISFTPEIRIRKRGNNYFITQKSKGTLIREEIEHEIDFLTYNILSSLSKGRIIKKTRYTIMLEKGIIAELDAYHEELEGLFVIETEFSSIEEAENFKQPSWFGKEVTEDISYKNENLAQLEDISTIINNHSLSEDTPKIIRK